MKTRIFLSISASVAILHSGALQAPAGVAPPEETATNPVGFVTVTCPAGSDTRLGIPFTCPPDFRGALAATPGAPAGEELTISANGTPGWTTDEFAGSHYVRFTSGVKSGFWYEVTGNAASSLDIHLNGDNPTGCVEGDTFKLVKFWTLDILFPQGQQTTFTESIGEFPLQQRSQLLFPDTMGTGPNRAESNIYILKAVGSGGNEGWVEVSDGFSPAGDDKLNPDASIIVRNRSADPATEFVPLGHVVTEDVVIGLSTDTVLKQDNPLGLIRPVSLALTELGVDDTSFVQSTSHFPLGRRDELFVYDNTIVGFNKPASSIYYKYLGVWYRDEGLLAGNPVADTDVLPGGAAIQIRKAKTADGATRFLSNTPNY